MDSWTKVPTKRREKAMVNAFSLAIGQGGGFGCRATLSRIVTEVAGPDLELSIVRSLRRTRSMLPAAASAASAAS